MTSLTLAPAPRLLEFFFAQYRRIWRGTAVTSVVTPAAYLLALGVGLGVFVDRSTDLPAGVSYLEFVAPGLMAATAMQLASFEATFPVFSAIKWDRQYHAMLASPLRVRDVMLGHQAFFAFRLLLTATVYFVVIVAFGAARLAARGTDDPRHAPRRLVLHGATRGVGRTDGVHGFVHRDLPVLRSSRCSSSRERSFRSRRSPRPLAGLPRALTPLWHGVTLCRDLTLGDISLGHDLLHLRVPPPHGWPQGSWRRGTRTGGGSPYDHRSPPMLTGRVTGR